MGGVEQIQLIGGPLDGQSLDLGTGLVGEGVQLVAEVHGDLWFDVDGKRAVYARTYGGTERGFEFEGWR